MSIDDVIALVWQQSVELQQVLDQRCEAVGIFCGYSWVKKQTQQPQSHLVIRLLAVAYPYTEKLDS